MRAAEPAHCDALRLRMGFPFWHAEAILPEGQSRTGSEPRFSRRPSWCADSGFAHRVRPCCCRSAVVLGFHERGKRGAGMCSLIHDQYDKNVRKPYPNDPVDEKSPLED